MVEFRQRGAAGAVGCDAKRGGFRRAGRGCKRLGTRPPTAAASGAGFDASLPGPLRRRIRSGCTMARFGRVHYGALGADPPRGGEKLLLCAPAQEIGPCLAKYPHNARCDSRSWQDTPTLYAKTALMANYRCRGAQSSRISPSRGRFPARARIMGEFCQRGAAGAVGCGAKRGVGSRGRLRHRAERLGLWELRHRADSASAGRRAAGMRRRAAHKPRIKEGGPLTKVSGPPLRSLYVRGAYSSVAFSRP